MKTYYHLTELENLESIAKNGLIPHMDEYLGAREMEWGKVINLALSKKDVEHVLQVITSGLSGDYFPVILEVKGDIKVKILNSIEFSGFKWAISKKKIEPKLIKVSYLPWEAQKPYLNNIRKCFEAIKSGKISPTYPDLFSEILCVQPVASPVVITPLKSAQYT